MGNQQNSFLDAYICETCGAQYPPSAKPPAACKICTDARQYVGLDGQSWTTLERLREQHSNVFAEEEQSVSSVHTQPGFAIGERAFLIQTPEGNLLWDCISLIDRATIEAIRARGGIRAIAISHPHYYTTMAEWSRAFEGVPIYVHEADREWVLRSDAHVQFWTGDSRPLFGGLTLIHTPGHFDGFQVLHWRDGAGGQGALFSGDQPQVCPDPKWLSFMYSYPNFVPLGAEQVRDIMRRLDGWAFDRIYGAFPKRTVRSDAKERLRVSAERYLKAIGYEGLAAVEGMPRVPVERA